MFEAVQRGLERGLAAATAAGLRCSTKMRAIVTASATHVVVFLPAMFLVEDSMIRGALELVAVGILSRSSRRSSWPSASYRCSPRARGSGRDRPARARAQWRRSAGRRAT